MIVLITNAKNYGVLVKYVNVKNVQRYFVFLNVVSI